MADKIREGNDSYDAGIKSINKKSFFGVAKPDHDSAAQYFEKAGLCFKTASSHEKAVDSFIKAAESHFQTNSIYMAAKALENAASITLSDLKNPAASVPLFKKASQYFRTHGSVDRAGNCLEKAARGSEESDVQNAGVLYIEACDLFEEEEKLRIGIETFRKTVIFFVKTRQIEKAILASERLAQIFLRIENLHFFYKQALSTIILSLAFGDEVDAAKRMDRYAMNPGFTSAEEGFTAGELIESYETRDDEKFEFSKKRQCIMFLDNEVAKLAMSLRIPGGASEKKVDQQNAKAIIENIQNEIEEEGFC